MKTDNQVADPSGKLRPLTHALSGTDMAVRPLTHVLSGTDMAEITVLGVIQ